MPVQRVFQNELLSLQQDRVAFERGPVVYCFEQDGTLGSLRSMVVPETATITAHYQKDLLGGIETLDITGIKSPQKDAPDELQAIPYFAWANRGLKPMIVWSRRLPPPEIATN